MSDTPLNRRDFLRRASVAAGAAGSLSALSGCGSDPARPPDPPEAPANLTAQVVTASRIDLSWSDNSTDETGFEIERRLAAGDFALIATPAAGITAHQDATVSESTMYRYRIRAVRDALASDFSNEAMAQTPTLGAPAAPTGLTATGLTDSGVHLSWTDTSDNEAGFRVQLRAADEMVSLIATPNPGVTEYDVTGLAPDETYRFFVQAFNESGVSGESNAVTLRTGPVAGSIALAVAAPGSIRVTWTDLTVGTIPLRLERRLDAGEFAVVATLPAGSTSHTDTGLPAAGLYTYRVLASGVQSVETEPATLEAPPDPPEAPSDLVAGADPADGRFIALAWNQAGAVGGFEVERSTGGSFTKIANATVAGFKDNPTAFLPFMYRVRSFNLTGFSGYSGTAQGRARFVVLFASLPSRNDLRVPGNGTRVTVNGVAPRIFSEALAFCGQGPSFIHLVRTSESQVAAVVANCTHSCCITNYSPNSNPPDGLLVCPCHGSRFALDGSIVTGPAANPEPTMPTEIFADRVEILAPPAAGPDRL